MQEPKQPYRQCYPGQAITAELCNQLQVDIRADIGAQVGQVETALDEHVAQPVDAAEFDGKTADEWEAELDKRYARLDHDHESVRRYRRYFLELETVVGATLQPAVLIHNMGRHPEVQVYQLTDLPIVYPDSVPAGTVRQFCFCGPAHHNDPEAANLKTRSWDERHWGDRIDDQMVDNLSRQLEPGEQAAFRAKFSDDYTLNVWLSNLEQVLFDPGPGQYHFDMGDVYRTQWVRDRQATQVRDLKQRGEWPARFVYRPLLANTTALRVARDDNDRVTLVQDYLIAISHLNLNEVEIAPQTDVTEQLMVILRS